MRYFNTDGPVEPEEHYCIPPLSRVDLDEIRTLIGRKKYFVLHAPRQTGKTTTLKALADHLNRSGTYHCVYATFEVGQTAREDVAAAVHAVLGQIAERARKMLGDDFVNQVMLDLLRRYGPHNALNVTLSRWAESVARPLVLLIDEIDALEGDSLLSVLHQLRAGYDERPNGFPQSVILCGLRDVRDYQIRSGSKGTTVKGSSAFNIKAKSLRLGDFSQGEARALLAQHTAETGQKFGAGTAGRIWELTRGQPWLVNALAYQACFDDSGGRDRSRSIRVEAIDRAKETLILNRVTHLDQLADKLREDRVRRVIMPMLAGSGEHAWTQLDLQYVRDLGLAAPDYPVRMANPIYAEVIPREIALPLEATLAGSVDPEWYVAEDRGLDVAGLLEAFQGYFREHAESWVERFGHKEAGPQLVLHAYLQRVVNSDGSIAREYAVGRGRSDLVIEWRRGGGPGPARTRKHVIECKVRTEKSGLGRLLREGREQTAAYMDRCGAESGHLVIFDMLPGRTWGERAFRTDPEQGDLPITVWGM